MMHHNSITIALTDEKKKPYREYGFKKLSDKCKTCEVNLPFNTEYQILAKNDNSQRIKLDIDIDGTIITGSGLIIEANSQAYIERFVETAKKLLFVKKSDERVADPTNTENGFLTIKVSKEKLQPYVFVQPYDTFRWRYPDFYDYTNDPYYWNTRYLYDPTPRPATWGGGGVLRSCSASSKKSLMPTSFNCSTGSASAASVGSGPGATASYSANVGPASVNCFFSGVEVGATVEGQTSNQAFITTSWNGEEVGSDYIFRFKMLGKETKLSAQEEKDLMEYKRLKAKFEGV